MVHGLNRYYYSLPIETRKTDGEQKMLMNLNKKTWCDVLQLDSFTENEKQNKKFSEEMVSLAQAYTKSIQEELKNTPEQLKLRHIGRKDPKKHLDEKASDIIAANVVTNVSTMIATLAF